MTDDARFERIEDGYQVTFVEAQMEFIVERLRWDRDELFAQLCVSCGLPGARTVDGLLSMGTLNLSSPRARRERAKEIGERARAKLDAIGMMEEVCQRVLKAARKGEPAIILRDVPKPHPDDEYDVHGFRFPKHHQTIDFGDGGGLKSYHGLFTGGRLAQNGVRVALFDWELDAGAHRLRLERLFGAHDMPDVRYVRCDRPLIYEVDRLRKIVRDERLEFGVFDSVGYACPGPPEAAEHAMAYARAVRQLGIGSLHIAHVRQGDGNDQRPFGSSFWHNSARSTWFVKVAAIAPGGEQLTLGLFNRKANLSALRPAVGFEVSFAGDRTSFASVRVEDVNELAENLPLWQRMKAALNTPKTLAKLAEDLGANVETLDRTVRRKSGLFTRVPGNDGITRIALVDGRAA